MNLSSLTTFSLSTSYKQCQPCKTYDLTHSVAGIGYIKNHTGTRYRKSDHELENMNDDAYIREYLQNDTFHCHDDAGADNVNQVRDGHRCLLLAPLLVVRATVCSWTRDDMTIDSFKNTDMAGNTPNNNSPTNLLTFSTVHEILSQDQNVNCQLD